MSSLQISLIVLLASISATLAAMYGDFVVELTPDNFDKMVVKSSETWLVKFYAPWCGHCQSSAPAFSKAAKKLYGVARLGVVDCDQNQELAQRYGVRGFPSLKIFKGEGKKARRPTDYNQDRSSSAFVTHIKSVMPNFVARVKSSGLQAFFNDVAKLPHVLLFTDKKSTSALYKGLSARFKGQLSFGELRTSEADNIPNKYSVSSYPTLLAFQPGENDPSSAHVFAGKMNPDSLIKFFEGLGSGNMNDSSSGSNTEEEKSERTFAQPKAYSGEVHSIVGSRQFDMNCDARKDGRMCALSLLPGGEKHELYNKLGPIAKKYVYDNMAFAVMNSELEGAAKYAELFGMDKEKGGFVVLRAMKRKYSKLEGDVTEDSITKALDKIVGFDAHWKKLKGDLPQWNVQEEKKEAEKQKEGESSNESGQCGTEAPKDGESCGAGE